MAKQTRKTRKPDTYRDWDMSAELIGTYAQAERQVKHLESRMMLPEVTLS